MSNAAVAYSQYPATERQEFRLPALLKAHVAEVAQAKGEAVAQYITRVLAEQVSADLSESRMWIVTAPEFENVLRALIPTPETPALIAARERAKELFGSF